MKKLILQAVVFMLACLAASGQRLVVESDTVEGNLLQQIDEEQNAAKKLELLEQFAREFPNHEAVTWVLSHLQADSLEKKNYDRVLQLATRILALDPDDVAAAHYALRAVEAKGEPELVRIWSQQTALVARRVMKSPRPDDPDEETDWKARTDFARQVEMYTEYSLYFAALNSKDSKLRSELIQALETRNPKSEYLAQMRSPQLGIARQVDLEEAVRAAEASFEKGEYTIDTLYMAATYYMQKRTEPAKITSYGVRLLDMMETAAKPAEMADADWEKRRIEVLGQTNWMVGIIFSSQERFAEADKYLRVAIQHIKDRDMLAGAYYHLGYVNYRIAESGERIRIHDAVKFTTMCSEISSAVQLQASENLKSMKLQYALP